MKKILAGIVILLLLGGAVWSYSSLKSENKPVGGGGFYTFYDTSNATSSVGIYAWTLLATSTPDQGFHRICDSAQPAVNVNNPVYLVLTSSSTAPLPTPPYGTKLLSGDCYTLTGSTDSMFRGFIFARASTSTTTLTQTFK
jgi:hypothetical protein